VCRHTRNFATTSLTREIGRIAIMRNVPARRSAAILPACRHRHEDRMIKLKANISE